VTIEDGSGLASELEIVEGLQFDRGFLSPFFINDAERQWVLLEDAAVLLVDHKLESLQDLLPLLEEVVKQQRPLFVVAEEVQGDALAALVINSIRGTVKGCAVRAPGFGDQRKALLQDIALLTGASVISDERGIALAKARPEHLGHARRVQVTKDDTTLVGGSGDAAAVAERVATLRRERDQAKSDYERERLDTRITKLAGGVAIIKVGAATETELKERKIRVEDALHATRAAVAEGIVPGGGVSLLRARRVLRTMKGTSLDHDSGLRIVERALEEPLRCIVANAGEEASVVLQRVEGHAEPSYGFNAATREYGDLLAMGVIDPAKVTRLALLNAGSIAALVLTTACLVARAAVQEASVGQLPAAPEPGF